MRLSATAKAQPADLLVVQTSSSANSACRLDEQSGAEGLVHPEQSHGRTAASGVVGQLLLARGSRGTAGAVATNRGERGDPAAAEATVRIGTSRVELSDTMTVAVRPVLRRFLELNQGVSQFVDRYVEVFVLSTDGLTAFSLSNRASQIVDSVKLVDRALVKLLEASSESFAESSESEQDAVKEYREQLRVVVGSLTVLGTEAPRLLITSDARIGALERLRELTQAAWRHVAGLFQIVSSIVASILEHTPPRVAASESVVSARASHSADAVESGVRAAVN